MGMNRTRGSSTGRPVTRASASTRSSQGVRQATHAEPVADVRSWRPIQPRHNLRRHPRQVAHRVIDRSQTGVDGGALGGVVAGEPGVHRRDEACQQRGCSVSGLVR